MLFHTPEFILFLVAILVATYALNAMQCLRSRNLLLLVASYAFYANLHPYYPMLLVYVTLVNYLGGLLLAGGNKRKMVVGGVVALSLLPLVVLKYGPAYTDSLWLPVGLSFFTLQALSYTLDMYRGVMTQPFSLLNVGLFVAFFPTLLSGPIERARHLIPQLQQKFPLSWANLTTGAQYFAWGLFKKIVIADRLAEWVDSIYAGGADRTGGTIAVAAVLYSFQIYCDFSGYATMALGVGRMLGIRLTENFRFPYFASSIKDFWRRWHISLTSWFTEYVYLSLGGNRVSRWRWGLNILTVFLLSGVWHGATWSFIIWGSIHGVLYLAEQWLGLKDKWGIYRLVVFAAVTLAWMFFRIEDSAQALQMISRIFTGPWFPIEQGMKLRPVAAFTLALLFVFVVTELLLYRNLLPKHWLCQVLGFAVLLVFISLFAVNAEQFVYFKF